MHTEKLKILITGGAGFIGSNLVDALLIDERIQSVRVLDNLSTGNIKNIEHHYSNSKFEFIREDIRHYEACLNACKDIDVVLHQAALGSVPRSINDPITTNEVNICGTLNIFNAAKTAHVRRVIYAASSSTYGDSPSLPKVEHIIGKPLSPYAVTKLVNELYADVFGQLFDISFIGLRYFNVFGPRQNPNGAYAAVIPLFFNKILNNESPNINGDGLISRDFTYVSNAVQANINAIFVEDKAALNQVYNIAFGEQTNLNQLFGYIAELEKFSGNPNYLTPRKGDIAHSLADISKAQRLLDYDPQVDIKNGLRIALEWYKNMPINYFEP